MTEIVYREEVECLSICWKKKIGRCFSVDSYLPIVKEGPSPKAFSSLKLL